MSHFRLHMKEKEKHCLLAVAAVILLAAVVAGYVAHSIGTARAKSRETVLLYTEEELEQYLLDEESGEYNLNGSYRLEEDLDLSWLYQSIGTNAEPFTGKLDGNGHVISGLARPLFGVMEGAEVENLFLGGAVIENPFTYYDGEHYVDGYGALAAYAIDSVIRNCGMNGEIRTASPSEAEYLLEKASPADAEMFDGPGAEKPGEAQSGTKESSSREEGPGVETTEEGKTEAETSMETRPEEGTGSGTETGTGVGPDGGTEIETETGAETGTGPETGSKPEAGTGAEAEIETGGKETSSQDNEHESAPTEETELVQPSEGDQESETAPESVSSGSQSTDTIGGSGGQASTEENPEPEHPETVGYQSTSRQLLAMKVAPVMNANIEEPSAATPFEATPSDAAEPGEENGSSTESQNNEEAHNEEEPQYIGNPNGDICILVTADRVTAGGLVAHTKGETLISDSFALVTISSYLEEIETYTGGLLGVLGEESRAENSYASGLSDSDGMNGGFVSVNEGNIENCYSTMTVGEAGSVRGAFAALGNGSLTGCIYDRQMACVEDVHVEDFTLGGLIETPADASADFLEESTEMQPNITEFNLRALNTVEMTGTEAIVPGDWYLTDYAYPQIEYFALHENEQITATSKVSAVALILPAGTTLADAIKEGQIILPCEVDGEEIQWEAEGNIRINEENHVVKGTKIENVTVSPHNVPNVRTSLSSLSNEETGQPMEATEMEATEIETNDTERDNISGGRLKVTIGNAAKNFALTVAAANGTDYANWAVVGQAVDTDGSELAHLRPTQDEDGYYLIGTPEALAWFAYKVNQGNVNYCAKLTDDIDLFGVGYGGRTTADANIANIEQALKWTPIATQFTNPYTGIFEGNKKQILNLWVTIDDRTVPTGFFGALGDNGKVMNLGVASGKVVGNTDGTGGVTGHINGKNVRIINCWNNASIVSSNNVGGIVGSGNVTEGTVIEKCYNLGTIINNKSGGAGGIVGRTNLQNITIRNCYNLGKITSSGGSSGGIQSGANKQTMPIVENCFNAGEVGGSVSLRAAICGESNAPIKNCYYDSQTSLVGGGTATGLSTEKMKTWALSYALNNQSMDGPWKYNAGGYPDFGTLDTPKDWSVIGQGIEDGLIKEGALTSGNGSESSKYNIGSAEQLAAFAQKVNAGNPGNTSLGTAICASLTANIDLTGAKYNGTSSHPIPWIPIGNESNIYKGVFEGNGKIIANMKVEQEGNGGLFGCAGGGAVIRRLGLDATCSVKTTAPSSAAASGGTAAFVGILKSVDGANPQLVVEYCYNRASVHGASGKTGAFVGSDDGTHGTGDQRITNCYTTGLLTTESGEIPGAIAGSFSNGVSPNGGIQYCYWDKNTSSLSGQTLQAAGQGTAYTSDTSEKTTAELKADLILDSLNMGAGTAIFERSDEKNNGYPTFADIPVYANWEAVGAAVPEPSCQNTTSKGTESNPYFIRSPEDLAWFAYQVNNQGQTGLCGKLMADISLFGGLYTGGNAYDSNDNAILSRALLWIPIGSDSDGKRYEGTFDGNGHMVSMMRVSGNEKLGLFGTVGNSTGTARTVIKNLEIATNLIQLQSAGKYAGGIAGYVNGPDVTISLCKNTGSLALNPADTGNYFGGILGGIGNVEGTVLDGCGNSAGGIIAGGSCDNVGGVLGGFESGTANAEIRNSYNLGTVAGQSNVGGITGNTAGTAQKIKNSYNAGTVSGNSSIGGIIGSSVADSIANCIYERGATADSLAVELESSKLKSWGAAWKLNGGKLSQGTETGISWAQDAENHNGYPYAVTGKLRDAENWESVLQSAADGLVDITKPEGTPYQISTAEQLAWFAYQVNHMEGMSGAQAVLTADIDMKEAESKYKSAGRLKWEPIGKRGTAGYTGSFTSSNPADPTDTHKIYQIQNLYVRADGPAGLFGTVAGGSISRIGLSNAVVTGENTGGIGEGIAKKNAGGIAGETSGAAIIAQCYNRSENGGKGSVTASGNAGGIVGQTGAGTTIRDCYNLETTIQGTGTSSHAGGIAGDGVAGVIRNSYNACGETGSITASGTVTAGSITSSSTGTAGAVNGNPGTGAGMSQCYSDVGYAEGSMAADRAFVSQLYSTGNVQLKEQTAGLNTAGGRVNTLEDRLWYTSLAVEATKGYPTLEPPVMITLSEAVSPADSAAGVETALGASGPVANARFRYAAEETGDGTEVPLAAWNADNYSRYGYNSANKTIGLAAGTGASGSAGTILAPDNMSLEQPAQELGNVSRLTLFTAAAYTCPTARRMLVELSSGTTRYEIRFTVNGVTGKTLKVVMPVKVTMENLRPDQTLKNTDSVDLFITNQNDYPVDGSIVSVAARDGDTYAVLKPVSRDFTFVATDPITQGVKLKIVDQEGGGLFPAEGIYYNPGPPPSWISYRLKNGGTLPYRYRMEYQAFQYFDTKNQYSYDVTYRFGVSGEDDAADGTEVLIKQAGGKTDG